jgi:hypothetical protein
MKRFNAINAACCSLLSLTGVGTAIAQQAGGGLEEIIVTAQKRSESLQEVPLSITALSSDVLEQRSVQSFADYGNRIPNLGFANTGDGIGTSRTISIRGISGDGVTGFYLDETPLPDSIDPRIVDIDRIEVLRGPQGTLYGARSMGARSAPHEATGHEGDLGSRARRHLRHVERIRPELLRRRRDQRAARRVGGSACGRVLREGRRVLRAQVLRIAGRRRGRHLLSEFERRRCDRNRR